MLTETPVLPVNVTDQIVLWGKERDRLSFHKGQYITRFKTPDVCHVY
jgi:hypothetical protein